MFHLNAALALLGDKTSRINQLKKRPENQDDESKRILYWMLQWVPEEAEKLIPWIFKEAKSGRMPNVGYGTLDDGLGNRQAWHDVFRHMADWVNTKRPDFMRWNWEQVQAGIKEWDAELAGKMETSTRKYVDRYVVHDFGNGWTMQWVRNSQDLKTEGELMGHCSGGDDYCQAVAAGTSFNYSLRDPKNLPHATLEFSTQVDAVQGPRALVCEQVQGKENKEPIPEYQAMIRQWIESLGKPVYESGDTEIEFGDLVEGAVAGQPQPPYGFVTPAPYNGWKDVLDIAYDRADGDERQWYGHDRVDWDVFAEALVESAVNTNTLPALQRLWTVYEQKAQDQIDSDVDRSRDYSPSFEMDRSSMPNPEDYEGGEEDEDYATDYAAWESEQETLQQQAEDDALQEAYQAHPLHDFVEEMQAALANASARPDYGTSAPAVDTEVA